MSAHDPFDGNYETSGSRPQAEASPSEAQAAPADPTPAQSGAGQAYSMAYLRRQDKDELQRIAGERGLDTSGTRDALISRIATAQAQS